MDRHSSSIDSRRIKKRHEIMERGVPEVWARSPSRSGSHRDEERSSHKSSKKKSTHSHSYKRHKHHKESRRHDKKSKKSSRRHSSESSHTSSSTSRSSRRSPSPRETQITKAESKKEVKTFLADKKKSTNYIELINRREEEEFKELLRRKQEQSDKSEDTSGKGGSGSSKRLDPKEFGRALLPGEGAAMAAYVAEGKRIPRRGEIGFTSDEIESFEEVGFVMSGSRHRRMEAVRLRKENQIYSADERVVIQQLDREGRAKKNERMQQYFTQIVEAKQQNSSYNSNHTDRKLDP